MEHAAPSFADVVARLASSGTRAIRVLPMFMAGGGHVDHDIPVLLDTERARHPSVTFEVLPPIGEHPRFAALIREIAVDSVG